MMKFSINLILKITALLMLSQVSQASVFLAQVAPLLPTDAKVYEVRAGDSYSQAIDKAMLQIFKTPTGKSFCRAIPKDADLMRSVFFSDSSLVSEAMSECRGRFADRMLYRIFPKAYYVVITDSDSLVASGWTTPRNETFLFFKAGEMTPERVLRSLTHEISISLDVKEKTGYAGVLDWTGAGIISDQSSCDAQQILAVTAIKQTFSALRAFQIETQIAAEAGFAVPAGFNEWNAQSCTDRFLSLYPRVDGFSKSFAADSLISSMTSSPLTCIPQNDPQNFSLGENLEQLNHLSFKFKDGREKSVCAYMSEALPYTPVASFSGGPGPRIGGGGWRPMILNGQEQKKIKGSKLPDPIDNLLQEIRSGRSK